MKTITTLAALVGLIGWAAASFAGSIADQQRQQQRYAACAAKLYAAGERAAIATTCRGDNA